MQNFRALGAPPPGPRASGGWGLFPKPPASGGWGLSPQTPIGLRQLGALSPDPKNSPPLRISGYAPEKYCQNFKHSPRYKAAFYVIVINQFVLNTVLLG